MRSEIIFFDNPQESANGTLRGLISLLIIVPLYYLIFYISPNRFSFTRGTIFWSLAMASAIGVISPKNIKELVYFGCCVGLIMFSLSAFKPLKDLTINSILDAGIQLSVGIILGLVTSIGLWYIYWNNKSLRIKKEYNIPWQIACLIFFLVFQEIIAVKI